MEKIINKYIKKYIKNINNICLVIGVNTSTGLSIVRNLGRNKIEAICFDEEKNALGGYSIYCSCLINFFNEDDLLAKMLLFGRETLIKIPVLVSNDRFAIFMDENKESLSQYFLFNWQTDLKFRNIIDKNKMLRLAKDAGINIPLAFFSDKYSSEEIKDKLVFPSIIKPIYTARKTKGIVVRTKEEFLRKVKDKIFNDGYIVQEVIEGPESDIIVIGAYSNARKKIFTVSGKAERQRPQNFGVKTVLVSKKNQEAELQAIKFLRYIEYFGPSDIEFKKSKKDGKYVFIEINPRISGLNEFYETMGCNLVYWLYLDLKGSFLSPEIPKLKKKIKWISIIEDLNTIVKYYRKKNYFYFYTWFKDVCTANSYAFFAIDDIRPFFIYVYNALKKMKSK